jgi:hypothetical protein
VVNIFKWPTELFQITIILVVSVDKSINKKTKVKKEKKTKMFTKINQFYKLDNQRAPFRTSTLGPNYPGSRAQSAATGLHSRRPVIKSSSTNTNLSKRNSYFVSLLVVNPVSFLSIFLKHIL